MDFFLYMFVPLRRIFDVRGRSGRIEMWAFTLLYALLSIAGTVLASSGFLRAVPEENQLVLGVIVVLLTLALLTAWVSLSIRRFHDLSYSGWQIVLWYVIAPIVLTVLAFISLFFVGAMVIIAALNLYLFYLMYFKKGVSYRNSWGDPYQLRSSKKIGPNDLFRPL